MTDFLPTKKNTIGAMIFRYIQHYLSRFYSDGNVYSMQTSLKNNQPIEFTDDEDLVSFDVMTIVSFDIEHYIARDSIPNWAETTDMKSNQPYTVYHPQPQFNIGDDIVTRHEPIVYRRFYRVGVPFQFVENYNDYDKLTNLWKVSLEHERLAKERGLEFLEGTLTEEITTPIKLPFFEEAGLKWELL